MKKKITWIVITILIRFTLPDVSSQNQSVLLPIPGDHSTNPTGTCQMIDFSNPSSPDIVALPAHPFLVNGNPGNPRLESDLYFATPSMDEYYLGQHPMYAQNITYDENGDILFFIIDNNIYNRYGKSFENINTQWRALIHDDFIFAQVLFDRYLSANHSYMWMLSPEIIVFPIATKCYTFGIIYSFRAPNKQSDFAVKVFYRELTIINKQFVELTQPIDIPDQFNFANEISGGWCGNDIDLDIAISKERANGSRMIFLSFFYKTFMFNVDAEGNLLLEDVFPKDLNHTSLTKTSLNPEMELIEIIDPVTQLPEKYRLAVPMTDYPNDDINNGYASIMLYEFDYNTLSILQNNSRRIELPKSSNLPSTQWETIKGMEFSPDGTKLFITYYGQDDIYYYDFDQSVLLSLNIPNGADYQYTGIERGSDGNLYFMANDQTSGKISRLTNPNNPDNSGWQADVFPTLIDELYYSFHYSDLPTNQNMTNYYSTNNWPFYKKLIFMDQIDGETYTNVFPTHWSSCCHPYSSSEWPTTADFDLYCNPVWVWEPGNNPFSNTTSKVTIEGTVEIPAGKKVTIPDLSTLSREKNINIVNQAHTL